LRNFTGCKTVCGKLANATIANSDTAARKEIDFTLTTLIRF
jgi:hypothetical protein